MSQSPAATGKRVPPGPHVAAVLAWIFPGLGHVALGRWRRGLLYAFVISFMFVFGLLLEGRLSRPMAGSYLSSLATLADLGSGLWYLIAHLTSLGDGRVTAATHEIGNTFHWSAGVMNMLLVLDAFDIGQGRK